MPRLYFETDSADACPIEFGGASDVLVYFLSLAYSTRYGSIHPFSQLALLLRGYEYGVDLKPLLTFADRAVEEEADQTELDRVWQGAAPLAASVQAVVAALDAGDARIAELTADGPDLRDRLDDLRRMAAWAAARDARVRLTFEL